MITQHKIIYNLRFVWVVVAAVLLVGFVGQAYGQAPTAVVLKTPATSPGASATPTFTVTVGATGGRVILHSSSGCSSPVSPDWRSNQGPVVSGTTSPYTVDVTVTNKLSKGSHTIYAQHHKDGQLYCSSASASYTYNAPPPKIEVFSLDRYSDTGSSNRDNITRGFTRRNYEGETFLLSTLSFSGFLPWPEAGDRLTITVSQQGGEGRTVTKTFEPNDVPTFPDIADGVWSVTAFYTDSLGNVGPVSDPLIVTMDTVPPVISVQKSGSGTTASYTVSTDETADGRYKDNVTSTSCVASADTSSWTAYSAGGSLTVHDTNGLCIIFTDTAGNKAAKHIADTGGGSTPTAPAAPSSITLSSPSSSPGSDTTPTFTVRVGETGGTVTLYSNNTCSTAASSAVTVSDTSSPYTVSITANTLSAERGYTFYAKHTKGSLASGCSSASASYTLDTTAPTTTPTTTTTTPRRSGGGGGGGGIAGTLTSDTAAAPTVGETPTTPQGNTPAGTCTGNPAIIALMPTYTRGTTNNIIRLFQQALNAQGYAVSQTGPGSSGSETSYFGPATERAVRAFQTARSLPVTGTLTSATQCALIPDIAANSLTLANIIADLQRQVAELIAARGS